MAILARRSLPSVQPLPKLPVEAGEHDDFDRDLAIAPPRASMRRHAWIGIVCLVLSAMGAIDLCLRVTEHWVPIPSEHVLPPR